MKKFLVAVLLASTVLYAGPKAGVVNSNIFGSNTIQSMSQENATRLQAGHYDMKKLNGAVDTANTKTITTYWGTTIPYICRVIYNNSATAVTVRVATVNNPTPAAADTVRLSLDAYQTSPLLPEIAKIFDLGETDSLIVFLQVYYQ